MIKSQNNALEVNNQKVILTEEDDLQFDDDSACDDGDSSVRVSDAKSDRTMMGVLKGSLHIDATIQDVDSTMDQKITRQSDRLRTGSLHDAKDLKFSDLGHHLDQMQIGHKMPENENEILEKRRVSKWFQMLDAR